MKAIVVGAGEVGYHIADRLSREGHEITIIEQEPAKERLLREKINAQVVLGSGASPETLEKANVQAAELFIAVTDLDEVNLIACLLAHEYSVPRKIARIKSLEYGRSEGKLNAKKLGIDLLINPQSVVADEIFNLVAYTSATEVAEFARGRVVFLGYPIASESPLAGVSMREMGSIRGIYRLVVAALTRGEETLIPRGDDVIEAGDTLYFLCKKEDLPAIRYLFGLEKQTTRKVFILGGGRVGQEVATRLARLKYRVTVVDRNPRHCDQIASEIERVQVLKVDGTDVDALRQEGLDSGDVFVAVTQDDKTNILCALLAKRQGVKRAVALVDQPEFVTLAPSLGVDACISPRLATAAAILTYVRRADVASMAMLEQGGSEVLELVVAAESPQRGRPLARLSLPRGAIVGVIVRGDEVIIPGGQDHLEAGDHVIVFALPDAVADVERFFAAR